MILCLYQKVIEDGAKRGGITRRSPTTLSIPYLSSIDLGACVTVEIPEVPNIAFASEDVIPRGQGWV